LTREIHGERAQSTKIAWPSNKKKQTSPHEGKCEKDSLCHRVRRVRERTNFGLKNKGKNRASDSRQNKKQLSQGKE